MTNPPLRPYEKLVTDLLTSLANLDPTRLTPEAADAVRGVVERIHDAGVETEHAAWFNAIDGVTYADGTTTLERLTGDDDITPDTIARLLASWPFGTTVVEYAVRVEFHTGEPITVTAGAASAATVDSMVEHYRWLATHNGSLHGRMVAAATVVTRNVTRYAVTYTPWEREDDPDA